MCKDGQDFVLSATDLANFLACRNRTALDVLAATGLRKRRTSMIGSSCSASRMRMCESSNGAMKASTSSLSNERDDEQRYQQDEL